VFRLSKSEPYILLIGPIFSYLIDLLKIAF
jgi:hypothetical protein